MKARIGKCLLTFVFQLRSLHQFLSVVVAVVIVSRTYALKLGASAVSIIIPFDVGNDNHDGEDYDDDEYAFWVFSRRPILFLLLQNVCLLNYTHTHTNALNN